MTREACEIEEGFFSLTIISSYLFQIIPVIKNVGNLPFRTCMGTGPNYYRTFDGLQFIFPGRCSYVLFNDGIRSVTLQTINCQLVTQCRKVGYSQAIKSLSNRSCDFYCDQPSIDTLGRAITTLQKLLH